LAQAPGYQGVAVIGSRDAGGGVVSVGVPGAKPGARNEGSATLVTVDRSGVSVGEAVGRDGTGGVAPGGTRSGSVGPGVGLAVADGVGRGVAVADGRGEDVGEAAGAAGCVTGLGTAVAVGLGRTGVVVGRTIVTSPRMIASIVLSGVGCGGTVGAAWARARSPQPVRVASRAIAMKQLAGVRVYLGHWGKESSEGHPGPGDYRRLEASDCLQVTSRIDQSVWDSRLALRWDANRRPRFECVGACQPIPIRFEDQAPFPGIAVESFRYRGQRISRTYGVRLTGGRGRGRCRRADTRRGQRRADDRWRSGCGGGCPSGVFGDATAQEQSDKGKREGAAGSMHHGLPRWGRRNYSRVACKTHRRWDIGTILAMISEESHNG